MYPVLLVMITSSRFFYDRLVVECFCYVWMKEYDVIMCDYPKIKLTDHLLTGEQIITDSDYPTLPDERDVYALLTQRLWERLYVLMGYSSLFELVMNWLSTGVTLTEVGGSPKLVYYYRRKVARTLNIHHCVRDFIPSFTVVAVVERE